MLPLNDVVVLYDFTYTRYTHVFRCLLPNGRQILLRASDEASMNLWISTINYAASFCSTGIRLRPTSRLEQPQLSGDSLPPVPDNWGSSGVKSSVATTISAGSTMPSTENYENDFTEGYTDASQAPNGASGQDLDTLMFARSVLSDLSAPRDIALDPNHWHVSRGDIMRVSLLAFIGCPTGSDSLFSPKSWI